MVRAALETDHPTAVDAELGRVGTAADAVRHRRTRHDRSRHCGINRTRAVLGKRCAAAAGECRTFQHDISDRHRHTLRDGVGVIGLGGADHQLIDIAADRAGWGFKVGAADKAHYPAAAVDAEPGRVGPAADAVRHHRTGHIGGGRCGINCPGAVFGKAGRDAGTVGEHRGHIAHIGHRHRHALRDGVGVARLGGGNDQVVNIVAAGVGGRFMVRAADKAHHPAAAVDAELGRVGTAADGECDRCACYIGRDHCGIDRTRAVLDECGAAGAGERGGYIAHIGHRDHHALSDGVDVVGLGGGNDQVVNIVAAGVGGRFMIRAADKAHHPAAAVDVEPGRVGTAADGECDRCACYIGRDHCGIDRTRAVLGECCAAAAGERGGHIAHIGHRHRHAVRGGVGVTRLGGGNDQVVNIVAARVCGRFMVRAADKADNPLLLILNLAESDPPLMLYDTDAPDTFGVATAV